MLEYAVSLKIGKTEDLVLISTATSDIGCAKSNLSSVSNDIKNGKYASGASAKLVVRTVTPWCEMNTKPIDYKWNGKAIA